MDSRTTGRCSGRALCLQVALCLALEAGPATAQSPGEPAWVPFLIGESHPDLKRGLPTPRELEAIRFQVHQLRGARHPPGPAALDELAAQAHQAMTEGRLPYRDASLALLKLRDLLNAPVLEKRALNDFLADVNAQLREAPTGHSGRHRFVRVLREVVASALHPGF